MTFLNGVYTSRRATHSKLGCDKSLVFLESEETEDGPHGTGSARTAHDRRPVEPGGNDQGNRGSARTAPVKHLPRDQPARQSITFDRGIEFRSWRKLKPGIGTEVWFCDPQAPWQKGSVENLNKRARRYLPRDTPVAALRGSAWDGVTCH